MQRPMVLPDAVQATVEVVEDEYAAVGGPCIHVAQPVEAVVQSWSSGCWFLAST